MTTETNINENAPAIFECDANHTFVSTPARVMDGEGCPVCDGAHYFTDIKTGAAFRTDIEETA